MPCRVGKGHSGIGLVVVLEGVVIGADSLHRWRATDTVCVCDGVCVQWSVCGCMIVSCEVLF